MDDLVPQITLRREMIFWSESKASVPFVDSSQIATNLQPIRM